MADLPVIILKDDQYTVHVLECFIQSVMFSNRTRLNLCVQLGFLWFNLLLMFCRRQLAPDTGPVYRLVDVTAAAEPSASLQLYGY